MRSRKSDKLWTADREAVHSLLEARVALYNQPEFIAEDPISIPHRYTRLQDIEIAGFWTAVLSWGQRKTILNKAGELFDLMGASPYAFILEHKEQDRERFIEFKHRTFQPLDTLYFLEFLQQYYRAHESLEEIFLGPDGHPQADMRITLSAFHDRFFAHPYAPERTRKHIPNPAKNAACKRINMFLRWMVRQDNHGVDFGLWKRIRPSELMIPLDVHVQRVAIGLGLLPEKAVGWKAVEELTARLRTLDPADPVKYDFALFGMGVLE